MMTKFVGLLNLNFGERYIDLSKIVAWFYDEKQKKITITLSGGYISYDDGRGDSEYEFHQDKDMGFDLLLQSLRKQSTRLWE